MYFFICSKEEDRGDDGPAPGFDMNKVLENDLKTMDPELDQILNEILEDTEILEHDDILFVDSDEEDTLGLHADSEEEQIHDADSILLYPGACVTVGALMLLLAVFTTKYNLVGDAIQQLLNVIAFTLPNGHNLCTNLYQFKKFFTNLRNPLVYHYYCSYCLGPIEDSSCKTCPFEFCAKPFERSNENYFLEIPLKNQIQNLFAHEDFYENLQHRFKRNTPSGHYEDIYDGMLYKSNFDSHGLLSDPNNISFTFNTDGAPVFKSSKVSVWPIFLVINELPYKQRMKKENMILASLWFGSQKPCMGTFLKPLQKTMKELYQGIECQSPGKGSFKCKGILLCGTADLPARSLLCNHMQYNGAYSCWKCEQQGISASVGKGQARVFPFDIRTPKGPERTVNSVTENARTAVQNQNAGNTSNYAVMGIKGPSWLLFFPGFNIVTGIAIDYMHGVLLGVQKLLLELWFLPKHNKKPFNIYHKLCEVDKRLLNIHPTLDITRLPRSIQDLKYWKASEYRSFLLFFGAPVLHGVLDHERFSHYILLVNAMHILLKFGSNENDIKQAEHMLLDFCKHFETMYDTCFMRLNVHQLLHLPDSVRNLGPLYTHSCFSFEDKNGVLLRMIRGTQNIDNQIVTGVSFVQKLPELKQKCIKKGSFCEKLYNSIESPCQLKRGDRVDNGIYILGGVKERALTEEENQALYSFLGFEPVSPKFRSFSRVEINDNVIYGLAYSRMVKRDNSTVEYNSRQGRSFGQVRFFITISENGEQKTLAFIEKLKCLNYGEQLSLLAVMKTKDLQVVPIQNLISSCMLIEYPGAKRLFVCRFPNKLESD